MSESLLDKLGAQNRGRGCRVCGERTSICIYVQAREIGGDNHQVGAKGKHSVARSSSLCDKHASELWENLTGQLP